MPETIDLHGEITGVVPKKGKHAKIEVKLEVPYSAKSLEGLADAMLEAEEGVNVSVEYEPMPLFAEDEAAQEDFDSIDDSH